MTEPERALPEPTLAEQQARLEAAAERMKAAEAEAAAGEKRPMFTALEQVERMLRERTANPDLDRLKRLHEQFPIYDTLAEQQAAVRTVAWQNDLRAAEHSGLAHWTLDQLVPDQHPQVLRRFVAAIRNPDTEVRSLILNGKVGPGKTSAAIGAGNAAAAAGMTVRFIKHSTYLTWLRPGGCPSDLTPAQIRERYRRCDLLILDDLGADLHLGEATEFVQRETNELVGDRLTGDRATIYTTNLTSEQMGEILGPRAVSRIGARAYPVLFEGPDRRKPVTW